MFPIRSKSIDGSFRTISTGSLLFNGEYPNGAKVYLQVRMNSNKVITIKTWACDDSGMEAEEGSVQIEVGDSLRNSASENPDVEARRILVPKNEVNQIKMHYRTLGNKNVFKSAKNNAHSKLKEISQRIKSCSNRNDFAMPMMEAITDSRTEKMAKHRLLTIARKIGSEWSDEVKSRIADECGYELRGIDPYSTGSDVQLAVECVYSLGAFGNEAQIGILTRLHECSKLLNPLIYVHGKRKIDVDWIIGKFREDCRLAMKDCKNNLQNSAYAVGMGLSNDGSADVKKADEVLGLLLDVIEYGDYQAASFVPCLIALGLITDSRTYDSRVSADIANRAKDSLAKIIDIFSNVDLHSNPIIKAATIADKMLDGVGLSDDEERFLLEKLDANANAEAE